MTGQRVCFVCEVLLSQPGDRRVEVTDARGEGPPADYCMRCWRKVSEVLEMYTNEEGISYLIVVRYWRESNRDEEG